MPIYLRTSAMYPRHFSFTVHVFHVSSPWSIYHCPFARARCQCPCAIAQLPCACCHGPLRRCLKCHVPLPCAFAMCHCHVPLPCAFVMCRCHVPLPCAFAMCLCHVPLPCAFAMCRCRVPFCKCPSASAHLPVPICCVLLPCPFAGASAGAYSMPLSMCPCAHLPVPCSSSNFTRGILPAPI